MNLKSNKGTFEGVIFFLLSPMLSLPVILLNLFKGNAFMNRLLICLCSFISFLYIPAFSNDKMRYLERYSNFKGLDLSEYLNYLIVTKRPDFILESLVYLFSKFSIRVELLFFLVTWITLTFLYEVIRKVSNLNNWLLLTTFFFLSLSFPNLFSGIRFYFGFSILVYAIYQFFEVGNKRKFIFFALLALFTHFSMSFLIITVLITYYVKIRNLKFLFFLSFGFFFIPKSLLAELVGFLDVSGSYNNKANNYLGEVDAFGDSLSNFSSFLAFHGKMIWYYFLSFYILFFRGKVDDLWWKYFVITAVFVNLTYAIPVVFFRYSLALKLIFLIFMIKDISYFRKKSQVYLYLILCLIGALIEFNQIRYNLTESILKKENILIYGILQQETNEKTFIDI